jgi:putative ATPase
MTQIPLPELLRPKNLKDFVGQKHLTGPPSHKASEGQGGIIRLLLKNTRVSGSFPSIIFWGPPGSGKTTLARIIARKLKREYFEFSAVSASIKEIEKIMKKTSPTPLKLRGTSPIFIVDEIHRFNKAQQAKLLPFVERGDITLIGATTENPSFEIIGPLLSRSRVLILNQLSEKELKQIAQRGIKHLKVKMDKNTLNFLIESSNGDARVLLNTLEIASNLTIGHRLLTIKTIEQALQKSQLMFDKKGEEYYNIISAFIKSMRASDVDAALYYLARMVEAGQDPLYIARRMVVFASEDVASPTALVVANAVFQACNTIGYPECQENLAAGTVYLATAKKDRSAYEAYMKALADVNQYGNLPAPLKIRNPVTKLMKDIGYGEGYEKYDTQSYLPEKLQRKVYFKRK